MTAESPDPPNLCTMRRRWTLCWSPNYLKWKLKPLELMIMSQNAVADEIEIPVTQPVLSLVLSPVHGLLRRCVQGAEIGSLEPVTSIRFKKKKFPVRQ